jgi:DNA polymerase-3 subunit epsilon
MSPQETLDAVVAKCTKLREDARHGWELADAILVMIAEAGAPTAILPRESRLLKALGNRPLVMLDLETSSADTTQARIIEVAAIKIWPDGRRETFETLINPGFDIEDKITEITGITNADLADAMDFAHYAPELAAFVADAWLSGFNFRNFDGPVLWEEFYRAGIRWQVPQDDIIDVMEVFHKAEPRSLTGAVRFYLGKDHEGAHRAEADAQATLDVLDAMLDKYQGLPDDIPGIIAETRRDRRIDMAGKIALNADGVPVFNFGKHGPEGGKTPATCASQRGYLRWMLDQGTFPANTLEVVQKLLG